MKNKSKKVGRPRERTLEEWLYIIEDFGSVTGAAKFYGMTQQGLGNKFNTLNDDDPLKQQYKELMKRNLMMRNL